MKKERTNILQILLMIVLAFLPLVTIIHKYDNGLTKEKWFPAGNITYDFFLYYKAVLFLIIAAILCLMSCWHLLVKKEHDKMHNIPKVPLILVGIYGIFVLLSASFAEEKTEAFWGGYESFEGAFVQLSYLVCFLTIFYSVDNRERIMMFVKTITIGSFVVGLLGTFQCFEMDWIQSDWAKILLTTPENMGTNLNINLNYGAGMSYATLCNPNYVGSYVVLVVPILIFAVIWLKEWFFKIAAGCSLILLLITLYAASSLGGWVGLGISILMFLLCVIVTKKKVRIPVLGTLAVVILAVVGVAGYKMATLPKESDSVIETMQTDGNVLLLELHTGEKVRIQVPADNETILNQQREGIQINPATIQVDENTVQNGLQIIETENGREWNFILEKDELKYITESEKFDTLDEISTYGFENSKHWGTNRGYIWSRTIPLLSKTILVGCGSDNFKYVYPNNDYVGKRLVGFNSEVITKPHNMYLQLWVQNGMFTCLALLALYLFYIAGVIKQGWNQGWKTTEGKLNVALASALSGYMAVGMVNDATICVAPVFWILLGLGYVTLHFSKNR